MSCSFSFPIDKAKVVSRTTFTLASKGRGRPYTTEVNSVTTNIEETTITLDVQTPPDAAIGRLINLRVVTPLPHQPLPSSIQVHSSADP